MFIGIQSIYLQVKYLSEINGTLSYSIIMVVLLYFYPDWQNAQVAWSI